MEMERFQIIYDIFGIPVFIWNGHEKKQVPEETMFSSPVRYDPEFQTEIEKMARMEEKPFIYLENDAVFYGIFHDKDNNFYCLGPVSRKKIGKTEANEYGKHHHIVMPFSISKNGLGIMTKVLALLSLDLLGIRVPYSNISIKSEDVHSVEWSSEENYETYLLLQSENDREHGTGIAFENRFMEIVKNGDVEAMKEALSGNTPDISNIGEVTSDNSRQMEYLVIILLTLITRAAVEGGMSPEDAYTTGDIYLREIEECKRNAAKLTMLGTKAQIEFTEKVRQAKNQRSQNVYINKCKDYIAKNLRKDIKVSEIAPKLGISRAYLTHKFSEAEGITIQQYIMKERCEHAGNLLKYSDYPISLISEYFGFSSQSHFGASFKKIFGMTPNEYRILHSR